MEGLEKTEVPAGKKSGAFQKLASFVGWIWGGLSILLGILMLAIGPGASQRIVGVSAICAGSLLLPPVVRLIRRRIAFMRTPGFPTIASVIVGGAILAANPWHDAGGEPERMTEGTVAPPATVKERSPSRAERRAAERQAKLDAEINRMWSELSVMTRRCDQAASAASDSLDLSRSSLTRAYSVVQDAKRTCSEVGLDVMGIDPPPSLDRDDRREFDRALNECGFAYAGKSVMFDRMLVVIDGDRRPSRIAAVQQAAQESQAQTVQCVLKVTALAEEHGVMLAGSAEASHGSGDRS